MTKFYMYEEILPEVINISNGISVNDASFDCNIKIFDEMLVSGDVEIVNNELSGFYEFLRVNGLTFVIN